MKTVGNAFEKKKGQFRHEIYVFCVGGALTMIGVCNASVCPGSGCDSG
jgi:hypothetical protein